METPEPKSSRAAEAQSHTNTDGSNDSDAGSPASGSSVGATLPYGKIAAGLGFIALLGAATTVVVLIISRDNSQKSESQNLEGNLRSGLLDSPAESSARPSFSPTTSPSFSPSTSPSTSPSFLPTSQPSIKPTSTPSFRPSGSPSTSPTTSPSVSPSTGFPSVSPTKFPTSSPTREVVPEGFNFRLKMHWERWYYWQEEFDERQWCIECTTCEQLTTSEFHEGCSDVDANDSTCYNGDQLWLEECDGWENGRGNAEFELVRDHPEADRLKILGRDLCLERADNLNIYLQPCDPNSVRQLWLGFRLDGKPFELKPYKQNWRPSQYDDPVEEERCITQHHHPKAKELLYLETCYLANYWNTALWQMV